MLRRARLPCVQPALSRQTKCKAEWIVRLRHLVRLLQTYGKRIDRFILNNGDGIRRLFIPYKNLDENRRFIWIDEQRIGAHHLGVGIGRGREIGHTRGDRTREGRCAIQAEHGRLEHFSGTRESEVRDGAERAIAFPGVTQVQKRFERERAGDAVGRKAKIRLELPERLFGKNW